MIDRRLDILLEHFIQKRECRHFHYVQQLGFCKILIKEGNKNPIECTGNIIDCELEKEEL